MASSQDKYTRKFIRIKFERWRINPQIAKLILNGNWLVFFPTFEILQIVWEERLKDIKLVTWSKGNNIWIYYMDIHSSCIVYLLGRAYFFLSIRFQNAEKSECQCWWQHLHLAAVNLHWATWSKNPYEVETHFPIENIDVFLFCAFKEILTH